MRGKWVGTYSIPKPVEKFLKRMIVPNADLRCTAKGVMGDSYWHAGDARVTPEKHGHSESVDYFLDLHLFGEGRIALFWACVSTRLILVM